MKAVRVSPAWMAYFRSCWSSESRQRGRGEGVDALGSALPSLSRGSSAGVRTPISTEIARDSATAPRETVGVLPDRPRCLDSDVNPGIRGLVEYLRSSGFDTTDSGDGITNRMAGMEGALPFRHVAVLPRSSDALIGDSLRLMRAARQFGLSVVPQGQPGWSIQATYDPADGSTLLMLMEGH